MPFPVRIGVHAGGIPRRTQQLASQLGGEVVILDQGQMLQKPAECHRRRADTGLQPGGVQAASLPPERRTQAVQRADKLLRLGTGDRRFPRRDSHGRNLPEDLGEAARAADRSDRGKLLRVAAMPVFDFAAFFAAFDAERRDRGLGWCEFADELWQQSSQLNARLMDHPLCGGAVSRLGARGATSCQYALFMLRWLGRAPEEFLTGPVVDVGDDRLPRPGPGSRLRWDLNQLHTALNEQRNERGLTWSQLAQELDCTPGRLTNLRSARLADMGLVMRVTQWLGKPAAEFIHAADW
jgi:hypothetical protein